MFCQFLSFYIRYLFKQIDSAVFVNFTCSLSAFSASLAIGVYVCERVSVFRGFHAVKCRIVSHRRTSHQQAAVVLARSCVQANYNHSQRLSANRGKVFNCWALTGALQFSVEFLMDKYGRAIHAQHSSLSSTVHTIITKSKLKTLFGFVQILFPWFSSHDKCWCSCSCWLIRKQCACAVHGVIFANLFYWIFASLTCSHFASPKSHRSSKRQEYSFIFAARLTDLAWSVSVISSLCGMRAKRKRKYR